MYHENLLASTNEKTLFDMEIQLEYSKIIKDLVIHIDDGVISKEVLKYISAHLRFDDKNLKLK